MNDNYKENTLERMYVNEEESSTDRIGIVETENSNNITNNNMNKVFIMLTILLLKEEIFNNKEKALEEATEKAVELVTNQADKGDISGVKGKDKMIKRENFNEVENQLHHLRIIRTTIKNSNLFQSPDKYESEGTI